MENVLKDNSLLQKGAVGSAKEVHLSKETIDKIFGVKEIFPEIADMELRYDVVHCGKSHIQEKIYRDQDGEYYMVVENTNAEQIFVPITRAAASRWSEQRLYSNELAQALTEFDDTDCDPCHLIWKYRHGIDEGQPDYIRECLMGHICCFLLIRVILFVLEALHFRTRIRTSVWMYMFII